MGGLSKLTSLDLGLGLSGGSSGASSDTGDVNFISSAFPDYPFSGFPVPSSSNQVNTLPAFSLATQLQATGATSAIVQQAIETQEAAASSVGITNNNKTLLIAGGIIAVAVLIKKK